MGAVRWFSRFMIFNFGRDVEYYLRNDLFERLTWLGRYFYERLKTGDLMSRMINDLTAVRMMVGMGVLTFANTPLYYVYALSFMFSMQCAADVRDDGALCRAVCGDPPADALADGAQPAVQEGLAEIGSKVQESLSGHSCHQGLLRCTSATPRSFADSMTTSIEQGLALARLRGALVPLIRSSSATSMMMVLVYGGTLVTPATMSIGDLVAFMAYLASTGLADHVAWLDDFVSTSAAKPRCAGSSEILRQSPYPLDRCRRLDGKLEIDGAVEWENVSFSYFSMAERRNQRPQALRAARYQRQSRRPESKLAIVGRTGAGKSTMVKLLTRLLEPTAGRVTARRARHPRHCRSANADARRRGGAAGIQPVFRHDRP